MDQPPPTMGADGRLQACSECGHYACICVIRSEHLDDCPFKRAATCSVGIECEHGRDVCPICDPCTCPDGTQSATA